MVAHQHLKEWWSRTGSEVATRPASLDEISALEARYDVTLPDDFRAYLRAIAPVGYNMDEECGTWWPIEQIKNIPDEYEHPVAEPIAAKAARHLFFADHLMWCWAWAICCVKGEDWGRVALIGGSDRYVANSFTDFVMRYTSDWTSIA